MRQAQILFEGTPSLFEGTQPDSCLTARQAGYVAAVGQPP
jgi:hypothetical protein